MVSDEAVNKQLLQEVAVMHHRLHGVPPLTAELQFILDAQQLDGYGREYYPVKVTSFPVNNSAVVKLFNILAVSVTLMICLGLGHIVKPFKLADRKVCDFACRIILAPFILAN